MKKRKRVAPIGAEGESGRPLGGKREGLNRAAAGFILGALAWGAFASLFRSVVGFADSSAGLFVFAGIGAWIGTGRRRNLLWGLAGGLVTLQIVAAYSPLVPWLMPRVIRSDPPQNAPAVFAAAGTVSPDGRLSETALSRITRSYELLRQGYAPRLILTRAAGRHQPWTVPIRRQMRDLGFDYPVEELGPVEDTHDEAIAVARLMKRKGWDRILVVSNAWHLRRLEGLFAKQGAAVICIPCPDTDYDYLWPEPGTARLRAFQDWIHEELGWLKYRLLGWV